MPCKANDSIVDRAYRERQSLIVMIVKIILITEGVIAFLAYVTHRRIVRLDAVQ
jgi:hypothetical protein